MSTHTHTSMTPPEPDLHPEAMLERARALGPLLIEQQAETEQRGYYSQEIHEAFIDAGFYLINHPRRYGGYEFGIDTFFKVEAELARGCGSTGWCFGLACAHTVAVAGHWEEEVQEELFGHGHFICPGTFAPRGSAKKVDGGWEITGKFSYASGSPYATHFWGHTYPEDSDGTGFPLEFIIEASEWTRLEDWGDTLGLKGSGSHSLQIERGFVPDRRARFGTYMTYRPTAEGSIGARLHGNTIYNGAIGSWLNLALAAVLVGMIRSAVDVFTDLMETKKTPVPPIIARTEDSDYQFWYGEALGRAFIAEAMLDSVMRLMDEKTAINDFTMEDDMIVSRVCNEISAFGWDTITPLVRAAGSSEIRNGTRMERILRDYTQAHTHTGYLLEGGTMARDMARLRWNTTAPPNTRTMLGGH